MTISDEILARCTNVLPGHGPRLTIQETLQSLAVGLRGDEFPDRYGEGEYLNAFEGEVAGLFGKEAAVFLPSGTMAQGIAMRIWCDRRKDFTVAMHPSAHLEIAEGLGYQFLHGIRRVPFGAPEFLGNRILTVKDLDGLGRAPGAILLELPYRPLGGELPTWDDLQAMSGWARERGVPSHMDGARIWSCRPHFGVDFAEIAALFDSLYVSFYKDLGGLAGSMLIGPQDFVKEARVWQRRMGGNLPNMSPLYVSARQGYERTLPQIDRWVRRAQEVAQVLARHERLTVRPNPPQVNFFQLYARGEAETLTEKHLQAAYETGTFLFHALRPTMVPGVAMAEIHCWENAMQFDLEQLPGFLEKWLGENGE